MPAIISTKEIRERQRQFRIQGAQSLENRHMSRILESARVKREVFDPKNIKHQAAYLMFMRTGNWPIQFRAELPFVTVPATVENKLLRHFLEGKAKVEAAAAAMMQEKQM